jgi:DNA-binding beta-propeller fold protein YncE
MPGRAHLALRAKILRWLPGLLISGAVIGCSQAPRPAVPAPDVFWPRPPDTPRVRFLYEFSGLEDLGVRESWPRRVGRFLTGSQPVRVRLAGPHDIFAGGDGKSYITDTATRSVHVFDREAGVHREISASGAGEEGLLSPIGIAAADDGRVFVSDSLLGAVFVYDAPGNFLRSIGKGELARPTGIALDGVRRRLYVVDTTAHEVKIFDLEGTLLFSIGGRGKKAGSFNYPTCVALDRDGRVYVGDTMNFRIQIFDREGGYLSQFGEAGDGTGYFSQIKGLDLDSEGHIYVTDARFDVVQVFTREGDYLLSIGGSGRGPGEFHMPVGLHIDKQDRIYVVDRLNQRIQVLQYMSLNDE